jgi:hypothetical protein
MAHDKGWRYPIRVWIYIKKKMKMIGNKAVSIYLPNSGKIFDA